jgi:hypothetical protein
MNSNPEFASFWKGRVLCQIVAEPTEKPLAKQQKIEEEIIDGAVDAKAMKEYAVIGEVGQAVALPSKNKYTVKFLFGGHELEFKPFD